MLDSHQLHSLLRYTHIAAGALGLLVFWIPVFARKGRPLHVRSGQAFVWLAYIVAGTAAVSCVWALLWPIHFTGITRELSEEEKETLRRGVRFLFAILGTLMTWLIVSLQTGVYAMRTKGKPDGTRNRVIALQVVALVASIGLLVFGLVHQYRFGGAQYFVCIALGTFGALDARKSFRYLTSPPLTDKSWWYMHMECMLGSGIAFHTAFLVFGFTRLLGWQINGPLAIVPWILPSAIGIPAIHLWINYYRRRFEKTEPVAPGELAM